MNGNKEFSGLVKAFEGTIELPTYIIKGENCNPVFLSQYGVAHIYPYTLLDDIDSKPTEKTYHTLDLENRYLRVSVIPDLGGRVYSVYDKISQREVFYKNKIVKFSPLAIRGAFFSGGVEFSFPVAHAPSTTDSVNWYIRQNPDGSASISFGGLEHISRLRWMITLTLFPDVCALAQDVWLYNPYTIPGRYHYWTNASLDADDKTEFVYPLRRVRSYEFAGTASWPFARLDLIQQDPGLPGMEGVPMWPADRMQEPVDFRWQKNMLAQVSIFGRDVAWDFFGAWQHSVNCGYAHFADHRDVAGMKLWSWGNAAVGVVNQSALTDDGSLYAETQCGAMETQLDFAFLQPDDIRSWREWWIPLRGLGGLTCASDEAGARLKLTPSENAGMIDFDLGVCPARNLGNALIQLSAPEKTLYSERTNLSPEQPKLVTFSASAKEIGGKPLRITVVDQEGQSVLDYTLDRDVSPVEPFITQPQTPVQTSEDFYQLGLKHENFDNREQAIIAYLNAIEILSENGEAQFRLGLMRLRAADYAKARLHLQKAVSVGLLEGNYYLGLIAVHENQLEVAHTFFRAVTPGNSLHLASLISLGTLALREKKWQQAIDLFNQVHQQDDKSIAALLLLGMAYRKAGKLGEARDKLLAVLNSDPLNHPALHEMALLDPGGKYQASLLRFLTDDRQYILDLACYYISAGLLDEALIVLTDMAQDWQYPMIGYLAAYLCQTLNRKKEAGDWLHKFIGVKPDLVFPSRLEEVIALEYALKENPQDHKAKYYLGNFLYGHQRYEDGIRLWQEAVEGLADFDVIYRNLGLASWQRDKDFPRAIELFEKALSLNPQNQDLYLHLDDLYKVQGLTDKRQQILEKINALPGVREDVHKRSMLILVELGRYREALNIMEIEKFVPLEMDQSFHNLYVRALMQRADDQMTTGRMEDAITDYLKALEFPANLGVGEPTTLAQAHIYYHLGLAYENTGRFSEALTAWRQAASEHQPHGNDLYPYVQMALDKLSRYSELGFE